MNDLGLVLALASASPLAAQAVPAVHTSHDQSVHALHPGRHGPGHGDSQARDQREADGNCCPKASDGKGMACCEKMKAEAKKPCCEGKHGRSGDGTHGGHAKH